MNKITPAQIQSISYCATEISEIIASAHQGKFLDSQDQWMDVWWLERCVRYLLSPCLRQVNSTVVKCILVSLNQLHISRTFIETLLTQASPSTMEPHIILERMQQSQTKLSADFRNMDELGIVVPNEVTEIYLRMESIFETIAAQSSVRPGRDNIVTSELFATRQHAQFSESQVRRYQKELAEISAKNATAKWGDAHTTKTVSLSSGSGLSSAPPADEANAKLKEESAKDHAALEIAKKTLEEKEQELNALRKRIEALQKEKEGLEKTLGEKNAQILRSEKEIAELRASLLERDSEVKLLRTEHEQILARLKEALERDTQLLRQVEENRKTIEDLQQKISELQSQIVQLTRERENAVKALEDYKKTLEDCKRTHEQEVQTLRDALAQATKDLPNLRRQLIEAEQELRKRDLDLQNAVSDRDRYKRLWEESSKLKGLGDDRIRDLESQIERLNEQLKKANEEALKFREWDSYSTIVDTLQKQLKEKSDAFDAQQKELKEQTAKANHSENLYRHEQQECARLTKSETDLKRRVSELESELKSAQEKLATLSAKEKQLAEQSKKIEELEQKVNQFEKEVSDKEELIVQLRGELNDASIRAKLANSSKGETESEVARLNAEFEKTKAKILDYQKHVDDEISKLTAEYENQVNELTRKLALEEGCNKKLQAELIRLKTLLGKQLAQMQQEVQAQRRSWEALKGAYQELLSKTDFASLNNNFEKLTEEVQRNYDEFRDKMHLDRQQLIHKLNRKKTECIDLQAQLKAAEAELAKVRGERETKEASSSSASSGAARVSIGGDTTKYPAMEAVREALGAAKFTFLQLQDEISRKNGLNKWKKTIKNSGGFRRAQWKTLTKTNSVVSTINSGSRFGSNSGSRAYRDKLIGMVTMGIHKPKGSQALDLLIQGRSHRMASILSRQRTEEAAQENQSSTGSSMASSSSSKGGASRSRQGNKTVRFAPSSSTEEDGKEAASSSPSNSGSLRSSPSTSPKAEPKKEPFGEGSLVNTIGTSTSAITTPLPPPEESPRDPSLETSAKGGEGIVPDGASSSSAKVVAKPSPSETPIVPKGGENLMVDRASLTKSTPDPSNEPAAGSIGAGGPISSFSFPDISSISQPHYFVSGKGDPDLPPPPEPVPSSVAAAAASSSSSSSGVRAGTKARGSTSSSEPKKELP